MFGGCEALTSINIEYFSTLSAIDMSSMFNYCSLLEFLILVQVE